MLRAARVLLVVSLVAAVPVQPASAQGLPTFLFERYLEGLRVQAGIPGISAAIVQKGVVVWTKGFGKADVEANIAASPTTPYPIGDLSQIFASTVLLQQCYDTPQRFDLTDRVQTWDPAYPEPSTTVTQLLTHNAPTGGFKYAPERFAELGRVITSCSGVPYDVLLGGPQYFQHPQFRMQRSVPGANALTSPSVPAAQRTAYAGIVQQMAAPYRIDSRLRPNRQEFTLTPLDGSTGIVSTVLDLASFDNGYGRGILLEPWTMNLAWGRAVQGDTILPTGLGWFVQPYNNEVLVWQFGIIRDAYSALILKLRDRDTTLILLANSDRLSAPYALESGDVTTSVFASVFLRLFVP